MQLRHKSHSTPRPVARLRDSYVAKKSARRPWLRVQTAAALLFSVFTSSILAILLTSSLYLVGHLSGTMVKLSGITKNPSFQQFTDNLYLILPNLDRLDLKNTAVYGLIPQADTLLINTVYAMIYTAALLMVTTVIFSRRQF